MLLRTILRHVCGLVLLVLLAGFLGATLVRLAPGFGVDEQELDARLSEESVRHLRAMRAEEHDLPRFYLRYLGGVLRGDLGVSRSLARPISELFADRLPVTIRSVGWGLAIGWIAALALAAPVAIVRARAYDLLAGLLSGTLLCVPVAVLALAFLYLGGGLGWAIALVVFPKIFTYARNLLIEARDAAHVLAARARGVGTTRILIWHIAPAVAPALLALAGVSVSMAFGAAIPIEAICDSPGLGQLAFRAALARDLPLLVSVTLLVTLLTRVANGVSDVALAAWGGRAA